MSLIAEAGSVCLNVWSDICIASSIILCGMYVKGVRLGYCGWIDDAVMVFKWKKSGVYVWEYVCDIR